MDSDGKASKVRCAVKNCRREIDRDKAIEIDGKLYCGICGVAILKSRMELFTGS
ncbi:MAG: hypothetical protein ACTSU5_11920 [Promethearchaeota archaeon]